METLGWAYLASMSAMVVFVLLVGFSSLGKRKLGSDESKPEYSRGSWFAMLLSAGTGVQLMYAAVSEPLQQVAAPPFGREGPQEEYLNAMNIAIFHWGLHPWAAVTLVALCLGYLSHRRGLPLRLSSAFHPLLGERVHGRIGLLIDGAAALATLLVVASGLAIAASVIAAGLNHLWSDVPPSLATQLCVLLALSVVATTSAAFGIPRGIRPLSELNLLAAGALLLFVFLAGQTLYLASSYADNLWAYLSYLPANSTELGATANETEARWLQRWTIPYWAWWLAWAPCVGTFIAKISKGRSIREVVVFALIVPALCSSLWLTVFGNSAFYEQELGQGMMNVAASGIQEVAVFELLDALPLSTVGAALMLLCMFLFAVTSTDSALLIVAELRGDQPRGHERAHVAGAAGIAAALSVCLGGASLLEHATLAIALPICVLLLAMGGCLFRSLRTDTP